MEGTLWGVGRYAVVFWHPAAVKTGAKPSLPFLAVFVEKAHSR